MGRGIIQPLVALRCEDKLLPFSLSWNTFSLTLGHSVFGCYEFREKLNDTPLTVQVFYLVDTDSVIS